MSLRENDYLCILCMKEVDELFDCEHCDETGMCAECLAKHECDDTLGDLDGDDDDDDAA
jgi:hypothetical protein